jgi:hypothetical protein
MDYTYHCFDWDDNLLFMPTNIILFHKDTSEEIEISTGDFAKLRSFIATDHKFYLEEGKVTTKKTQDIRNFKNYVVIGDDTDSVINSFREFRDCEQRYFLTHLKEALKVSSFGPEWAKFIEATNKYSVAKRVYIITARGHMAQTIYEGIKFLKEQGIIKNIIPRKNIFPVSNGKHNMKNSSTQDIKYKILKDIFSEANQVAKKEDIHHTVYFSDDDFHTFSHLKDKLCSLRNNTNYWKHIHIKLRFTGKKRIGSKMVTL